MTCKTMPLSEAIDSLTEKHEAERARIEAWADDVAPKLAADLGISVDQMRVALDVHVARHVATLGEVTREEAAGLAALAEPKSADGV